MQRLLPRAFVLMISFVLASCAALFPRSYSTEERLAMFPVSGLNLEKPVTIRWNKYQIPYVEAQTDRDLAYALGLVQAHLRLTQVALAMRLTEGRAAEMGGPFYVPEIDKALRAIDIRSAAKRIAAAMPAESRAYLQAFVDGMNDYQRRMDDTPPEWGLLGLKREDYTIEDVIAIGRVAGVDINWFASIGLMRLRDDPQYDAILARLLDAGNGPTVSFSPEEQSAVLDYLNNSVRSGSNSFAVSAARSATGGALIANDPHLGVGLPNLWLIAGIKSPGYHGVGMLIPGTPFLAFGRTPDIAWGGTNMRASHSEFYDVSKLEASRFEERTSRIAKRLWFSSEVTTRSVSGIGPVISDTIIMQGATRPGEVIALRWIGLETTDEITAILKAAQARTPQQFREALKTFALPAQNMVYADVNGNIAQVTATMLPRRSYDAFPRNVVLDASDPATAWRGFANATELPWTLNPASGFVASANNKPFEAQPGVPAGFFFSADERIRRIKDMLSGTQKLTLDDLKRMQLDTVSLFSRSIVEALRAEIAAAPSLRAADPAFVDRVLAFDGDYRIDSKEAPAFEALLYHLVPGVYGASKPPELAFYRANWNALGKFFAADFSALPAERRQALLADAIAKAAPDAAKFATWGEMHRLQIAHLFSGIPVIGGQFIYGDVPTAGSRETVFKSAHGLENSVHNTRYGSQSRQLSDMSDPDANYFVLLGGNDGWIGSANFMDQIDLWQRGEYIRMPLRPDTVAAEFPTVMNLSR